jgi:hypothetical protein
MRACKCQSGSDGCTGQYEPACSDRRLPIRGLTLRGDAKSKHLPKGLPGPFHERGAATAKPASDQIGHETAQDLSDALVKKLTALGFNAEQLPRGTPAPDGALVVDGKFLNVDEGNRLRRLVIGFGAGASKLDTDVNVYQVSNGAPTQLLDFTTHAESSKMPGAAVTMGAGAAAQGGATVAAGAASAGIAGVKTYRSTVGFLADSTAKQIVAYFSQYAAGQGWISQDQAQKVKLENAQ